MDSQPSRKTRTRTSHPLVGKWFHSYVPDEPDVIRWQGQVLAAVGADTFLVQLYEWFMGEPSQQRMVSLAEMKGWSFYSTNREMNATYANYADRRNAEFDAKTPIDMTKSKSGGSPTSDRTVQ